MAILQYKVLDNARTGAETGAAGRGLAPNDPVVPLSKVELTPLADRIFGLESHTG